MTTRVNSSVNNSETGTPSTTTIEYDHRVTSVLTEHFGYPPLAVIDDVINAVNHILYKCTQAMETYLVEQHTKRIEEFKQIKAENASSDKDEQALLKEHEDLDVWVNLPKDEISLGTAKLETLLENQVDKNFDKFELYALRNIFTIPVDLVDNGWIRLKHHEHLDFSKDANREDDEVINKLIKDIRLELKLREILKLQVEKGKRLVDMLRKYSNNLKYLNETEINKNLSEKGKKILEDLSPIDDNLYFILQQVNVLIEQMNRLYVKFEKNKVNMNFKPSLRDFYINGKSFKLLQSIGVTIEDSSVDLLGDTEELKNGVESVVLDDLM
ncbi:hypothetical protein PSN45_004372 [Yamadazyma tenuis]|uniref:Mis12-domain-containing protein n=1 Tax=Candida tenuis (strain ATCC 10573 / BCRC 21748 / CBS 615 / JCM 9827 / NBRC 10315 / NRRL Y-1498 / VKM Y-70) TaxID=590646 RepID=G3B605_CANTC|nr:uncharacterized protein CANTEDRAFT_94113 [Yamadazyma tenuis ATCC 10573]EGV63643.1 hypothetical protein CANTEDRAFT_94113 [Yamadazyma tenuis ATCC 10573]WEJ96828.1 hypothetical protein PSN45_004372 [Yamadazyma tenuis]